MNVLLANLISMIGGPLNGVLGLVQNTMQKGFQTAIQFHKGGIAFARDMGLSAKEAQAYTNVLIGRTQVLANRYGVSAEAIMQVQRGLSEATGKQLMLNDAQAEGFVQIDKMMGAQSRARFTEEIMSGMGGQIDTVQNAMAKVYATASKQGLNAKKLTDKVAQNLLMANRLSFRNGIDGITRMAALSEKLSINMASVETAASQFLELDKAIENAAKLQMLGGSAAVNFGNPLTASFEANYDPETFAQRLSDSLASYATFDKNKGVANINGMNMDFVRNIADAMRISVSDAAQMAKKQAEVKYKEAQFGGQLNALGLSEEQRNFLVNNSQVKNGELYYTDTKGNEHNINREGVNGALLDEMRKFSNMSDKDILVEQSMQLTSIDEGIKGAATSVVAAFAKGIDKHLPDMRKQIQSIGNFLQGYAEQWGADTGKVIGKAMHWINNHGSEIATVASGILGFVSKLFNVISEYTKTAIGLFLGYKLLLKPALSGVFNGTNGIGGKAAKGVLSGAKAASRGVWNGIKAIWQKPAQLIKGAYGEKSNYVKILNRAKSSYRTTRTLGGKGVARGLWNATKTIGKNAKLLAPNSLRLLKSGGVGIAGAIGNIAIDSAVANGKIKKGGVAHYASKMTATAAEYGAIGSMLGPIGTGVGAAVGAIKGAYDTWKSLPENADKNFIDYAKSVGESIVDGGKAAFNFAKAKVGLALSAVNKEIQDRGGYLTVAFNAITTPIRLFIGTLEGIAKFIVHPVDTIKGIWDKLTSWLSGDNILGKLFNKAVNIIIGEKHANGGIVGVSPKQPIELHANGGIVGSSNVAQTPITSQLITNNTTIEKHDIGGIVGGNSYSGDKVLTGLNSGEMVLNKEQQSHLFTFINSLPSLLSNNKTVQPQSQYAITKISASNATTNIGDSLSNTTSYVTYNPSEFTNRVLNSYSNSFLNTLTSVMSSNVTSLLTNKNDIQAKPVGEKEYIYTPSRNESANNGNNTVTIKDFNINLSGTLKLDGGNYSKNIDMNSLLNDFQFINALKEMIKTSINNDMNGGRFMNDLATLRGQTSSLSIIGK